MNTIHLYDFEPQPTDLLAELLAGLQSVPKYMSMIFNYDERGSALYETLCQTEGYYLTRTEMAIMQQQIERIVAYFDDPMLVIEYGSGNAQKTMFLFDHLPNVVGYIPIDISRQQLIDVSNKIARTYPRIEVLPVCADYNQLGELPIPSRPFARRLMYFPGSTIGNVEPDQAMLLLRQMRQHCQPGDVLLIGVDLVKDPSILKQAYDGHHAVSRELTLINPLQRLNRTFGTNFDISQFTYHVVYNEQTSCIELYVKSLCDQSVVVNGAVIHFAAGELIKRLVAYKYRIESFQRLAEQAGWQPQQVWTDDKQWFSIHYFTASENHM